MADIRAQEHPSDVSLVSLKRGDRDQRSNISILLHLPNVDVSLFENFSGFQSRALFGGGVLCTHAVVAST